MPVVVEEPGSCVGSVEFAQHFREEILEVEIVVQVRDELLVIGLVAGPVDSVDRRVVELLLDLLPNVIEDVIPLGLRLEFIFS